MKKLLALIFVLTMIVFSGQKMYAQDFLNGRGEVFIFPDNPGPNDSVFINYAYISNDGCPDFNLRIDSVINGKIYVKLDKITDSTRICTMVISKFKIRLNLGLINRPAEIYLDGRLIKVFGPECVPNRTGRVVAYTENSTLIQEDSTKLMFQLFRQTLKMGTPVRFNGTEIQCIKAPCFNIVNCFQVLDPPVPPCEQNRKGIIVAGKDACTGKLFIQEYSPISSALQLWGIGALTADAYFKPGDQVVFGGIKMAPDTTQSFYCRLVGMATCIRKIQSPAEMVELTGSAIADSVVVQSGYAVLFGRDFRKALASTPVIDGKFKFRGVKNNAYTVFVIPDKRMYPGYLPTFYKDKLNWKLADYITLADSTQSIQVQLLKYIQPEGTGKISGRIHYQNGGLRDSALVVNGTYTENKSTGDSTACNIPVMLYNQLQKAIAWTLTDANGFYVFDKVHTGNYAVVAETPVASAVSPVSVVDETTPQDVNLMLKSTEAATENINPVAVQLNIYPNPVEDQCYVDVQEAGFISIYTISGQLVMKQHLNSGSNNLNLSELKSGLYLARFGEGVVKMRKK